MYLLSKGPNAIVLYNGVIMLITKVDCGFFNHVQSIIREGQKPKSKKGVFEILVISRNLPGFMTT